LGLQELVVMKSYICLVQDSIHFFSELFHNIWNAPGNLVFKLVLFCLFLPCFGAFFNVNIYHVPIFIGVVAILLICTLKPNSRPILVPGNLQIALCVLMILLIIQILSGRGFGILSAGGYVILMSVILLGIMNYQAPNESTIIGWVSIIFQTLAIGVGIELIIILLGKQPVLTELFYSEVTTHYKNYNPADLIRFLGLAPDSGGPNSILLGSQVCGMLCLFSTLWFFYLYRLPTNSYNRKAAFYWLVASFILLLFTINGTVTLLAAFGFCLPYYFSKNKKQKLQALIFIFLLLITLFMMINQGIILNRVFSGELAIFSQETLSIFKKSGLEHDVKDISVFDFYILIFFRPVELWYHSDLFSQFFGAGNSLFLDENIYIGGDFGFGSEILLKTGLIWACAFTWIVLVTCLRSLSLPPKTFGAPPLWVGLARINALMGFLWLISLIHYTPSTQNAGGYSLFALNLALVIYCKNRSMSGTK